MDPYIDLAHKNASTVENGSTLRRESKHEFTLFVVLNYATISFIQEYLSVDLRLFIWTGLYSAHKYLFQILLKGIYTCSQLQPFIFDGVVM